MTTEIKETAHKDPIIRTVTITDLDNKGKGIGNTDTGGRLTIPYTIPGETVEAVKLKRKQGKINHIIEPSPHRIEPTCNHFGLCGGCSWQHIDYDHQLQIKKDRILRRFKQFDIPITETGLEIEPSPPFGYRNRMDFLWWYDGRFGLRESGKWYSMVQLDECHLISESVMSVALEVNRRVKEHSLPYFDNKQKKPGMRYLIVRRGIFTGEIMLLFVTDKLDLSPSLWKTYPM
jgi:23S rRNA (uracil1939-C5)-methyltransferase